MNTYWWGIVASILLIISGLIDVITGKEGSYWGFPVPAWSGWIFLPIGIIIFAFCIRALRRGEGTSRPYSDEDAARAKEELDHMYLKEHGSLPNEEKHKTGA